MGCLPQIPNSNSSGFVLRRIGSAATSRSSCPGREQQHHLRHPSCDPDKYLLYAAEEAPPVPAEEKKMGKFVRTKFGHKMVKFVRYVQL